MHLKRYLILLVAALVTPTALSAQATTTITGTVKDPSGAAVTSARVVVQTAQSAIVRQAETGDAGEYSVALLPPAFIQSS